MSPTLATPSHASRTDKANGDESSNQRPSTRTSTVLGSPVASAMVRETKAACWVHRALSGMRSGRTRLRTNVSPNRRSERSSEASRKHRAASRGDSTMGTFARLKDVFIKMGTPVTAKKAQSNA
eukprot:scaffold151728_cov28-Tisochrysis_lutea.AAC.1